MHVYPRGLNVLQKISLSLMAVLVVLTFIGANLHAILWQSSHWLVSTVLPAVVVDLTNKERSQYEIAPLVRNEILDTAAQLKAEHMAKNEYFAHYSPTGVSPWYWFDQVGYVYAHAGENLAIHFTDSTEVVNAWMKSPTHRQNIVGPQYTEIGVGTAKGTFEGYDTVYVVQLFGAPAARPVAVTQSPAVAPSPTTVTEVAIEQIDINQLNPVESPSVLAAETELEAVTEITQVTSPLVEEVVTVPAKTTSVTEVVVPAPTEEVVVTEVPVPEEVVQDIVVIESPLISTSSGLTVAQITTPQVEGSGLNLPSIATQPNTILQFVYFLIGSAVVLLLSTSIVLEARRFRVTQVLYGVLLLCGMGALWYIHVLLTGGAIIV